MVSSILGEAPVLQLSSYEELNVVSIKTGEDEDSPPHTPVYEELLEVVTHAVARLNVDWPAKKQEVRHKSKLYIHLLPACLQRPWGLPFFYDLHTEVSRSWKKPVSYCVFSPQTLNYSNILGLKQKGYGAMPRLKRRWPSISPLSQHCPLKPRGYPPSLLELHLPWWVKSIRLQVRPLHVCIPCLFSKHIRPTC